MCPRAVQPAKFSAALSRFTTFQNAAMQSRAAVPLVEEAGLLPNVEAEDRGQLNAELDPWRAVFELRLTG